MDQMIGLYSELYDMNLELLGEYKKRATNHELLLNSLREVNKMIQKAARLRMGSHKSQVISACRGALKSNNVKALFSIIKEGHA